MPEYAFTDLQWALAMNTHGLETLLLDVYKDRLKYLDYINNLVSFLRAHHCDNIQEKLKCISNVSRFRSAQSELEVAKDLIDHGKIISLIPDDYAGMKSPPDMLARDSQVEAYIEVKHVKEDPTVYEIIEHLRQFLGENKYPYVVNLELSENMSIPTTGRPEREEREGMAKEALKQLKTEISKLSLSSLPIEIETGIGKFKVCRSESGRGFPGVIHTSVYVVPKDKLIEKIRHDVKQKASKRIEWSAEHQAKIYIVALDFEEMDYDEDYLEEALIGQRVTVMPPFEVQRARKRGWEDFLRKTHIIPDNRTYLDWNKRGVFLTEPIMRNVSGVIGRFRKKIYFVPNPFSYDEINDPRLVSYI